MSEAKVGTVVELAAVYRRRLYDLSWFIRTLNEDIARRANAEDGVKGRFKCQALLDEPALLAALAYVDFNPIRAGIAETPEDSDHTSIQERIRRAATDERPGEMAKAGRENELSPNCDFPPAPLMPFDGTGRTPWAIPYDFCDYLELVGWTGPAIRPDKRGFIPENTPKILTRLGIDPRQFIASLLITQCHHHHRGVVREIRTLRSVGAGGGRPPPAKRWRPGNWPSYRDAPIFEDGSCGDLMAR